MMADCIGASNRLTDNGFTVIKVGIYTPKSSNQTDLQTMVLQS